MARNRIVIVGSSFTGLTAALEKGTFCFLG